MNTWICNPAADGPGAVTRLSPRRLLAPWFAFLVLLTGCGQDGVSGLAGPDAVHKDTFRDGAIRAVIGDGRIAVHAPSGYCIDRDTLDARGRNGFAMLARCDLVDKKNDAGLSALRAPALITVTTRPWTGGSGTISADELAAAYPAETVLDTRNGPPAALIRVSGGALDLDGVDDIHWRGALVVNDQLVTLGLFAPSGNAILGAGGGAFLTQLARRIARDSANLAATQ